MPRERKLPPGMKVRGRVYYACFRAHGRLVQKKLSGDFASAVRMLNDLRARADRMDFGLMDNACSLATIREAYERHCRLTLRPRTSERYRQNLSTILAKLPVEKVSQLSTALIDLYRCEREGGEAGVSPRTINMEVGALATMLRWAVRAKLIGSNPLEGIKPLATAGKERKERRSLTAEEVQRLFEHSPAHLKPVWRMFMTSGLRLGELCALRFSDVDFAAGELTIRAKTAKSKRERTIPLDEDMLATIRRLRDEAPFRVPGRGNTAAITATIGRRFTKEHVFVTLANTPWHGRLLDRFYAICKRAGIEGAEFGGSVDLHSLRVTFATLAIEHGASPKAVQEILGHRKLDLTMKVYTKATDRAKRAAVSALPFASAAQPGHVVSLPGAFKAHSNGKDGSEAVTA